MRGLIPAHIMAAIEKSTGLHMADMVDMFTGASTGAILNAALTRPHRRRPHEPQYKARHMIRFYESEGANIFPRDRFRELRGLLHDFNNRTIKLSLNNLISHGYYSPRNLANALYALYGDAKLGDSLTSLVIPCYSLGNETNAVAGGHAVWLKNINGAARNEGNQKPMEVTLYDAVMASTAAPTYFPCHDFSAYDPNTGRWRSIHAIDGSIFDNPAVAYQGAVRQHVPEGAQPVMICLGTGITNRSIHKDEWNSFGALGVVDPANDLPLINIFFHATESALMESFGHEMGRNLYILNRSLLDPKEGMELPSGDIDDATPENIERLGKFAALIIEENQKTFDSLCHLLVSNRDRKMKQQNDFMSTLRRTVHALTGISQDS
ncbi:MAG: patatin-like phospholipase family protein [Alphaproteobacteria bacterium]|nr:patatin-like phospholipase family protein [Alphaproteobacteria bacterium]